ncbi:MAG: tyrosine-type recombinase/integrase [Sulfitobacter sp.]
MKKRSDKYPRAKAYRDRHGKRRWRYRVKGFTAELGTDYGSDDFEHRYQEAENGSKAKGHIGAGRTIPRSLDDLIAHFYKLHFPTIEESTRADYRSVIEPLREKHGRKRVAHLKVRHVMAIKAEMHETPSQANKTIKRLSQLMDLAVEMEWITSNPVKGVKKYVTTTDGFHTWDEGEIARFYEVYELGTPAHLCMTLMLYTGAAKVDAVKLGPSNVKDGRIKYRRQKTKKNPTGVEVDIPMHPALAEAIDASPATFTFLETRQGKPRTRAGLGSSMRKWCDAAGLPLCSSHGLRKAICRRIAEAGGTPFEIMSVSGQVTLAMAQKYCETFGRRDLADSAFSRLDGTKAEQNLTNHPARFVRKCHKQRKLKDNK